MIEPQKFSVLGQNIAAVDYNSAVRWCLEKAQKRDRAYVVEAANTHVLSLARHDRSFGEGIRKFDLICPDGMPLVWVVNSQLEGEARLKDRVYGPTLMLKVLQASEGEKSASHFLLGGKQETLDVLERNFAERFPNAHIAGSYSPPFGEWPNEEHEKMKRLIRESGASLVWVGLGCPKQERWIAEHLESLPPAVYFGIGAAFAFHAGEVKQAPSWIQKCGLEWLFRLCAEPRRLWKRYAVHNSLFLYYLIRDQIRA